MPLKLARHTHGRPHPGMADAMRDFMLREANIPVVFVKGREGTVNSDGALFGAGTGRRVDTILELKVTMLGLIGRWTDGPSIPRSHSQCGSQLGWSERRPAGGLLESLVRGGDRRWFRALFSTASKRLLRGSYAINFMPLVQRTGTVKPVHWKARGRKSLKFKALKLGNLLP